MNITRYGQNLIHYIGTSVFKVKHNDVMKDVLFFITNVNDTKVIFGLKACQVFKLVKILCDDQCQCKKVKFEVATVNEEFLIGLSVLIKWLLYQSHNQSTFTRKLIQMT